MQGIPTMQEIFLFFQKNKNCGTLWQNTGLFNLIYVKLN